MRAVVFDKFGEPAEVLSIRDVPVPLPGSGQVRVRMLASPVNPSDLMTVRGVYGHLPQLPATPGYEGVGMVDASGGGLWGRYLQGKRVAVSSADFGKWCEYTLVPAMQAVPVPGDIPLEQAAMFFVNPVTAYVLSRVELRVPPGEWLLQTAAGSAVGRMIIRLGQKFGFRTLNVVRRAEQAGELQALGADEVVVFDPQRQGFDHLRSEVLRITANAGVRYAIDPVGGVTGSQVAQSLAVGGRMLVYGSLSEEPLVIPPRSLLTPTARIEGFWLARWLPKQSLPSKLRVISTITRLMREKILVSEVGESFQLEEVQAAVRTAERTARGGKVLLRIAAE
jgi:NADPH:quinone reductase-like Zn-dependent oxidoreductase